MSKFETVEFRVVRDAPRFPTKSGFSAAASETGARVTPTAVRRGHYLPGSSIGGCPAALRFALSAGRSIDVTFVHRVMTAAD
jgi:hypothetical protein